MQMIFAYFHRVKEEAMGEKLSALSEERHNASLNVNAERTKEIRINGLQEEDLGLNNKQ